VGILLVSALWMIRSNPERSRTCDSQE
jgi:hypothetical protein